MKDNIEISGRDRKFIKDLFKVKQAEPLCGVELTINQRIWQSVNQAQKKWHEQTLSPPKGESKKLAQADYHKYLAMRDELIFEQKDEIAKLKMKVNKLENKVLSLKIVLNND